MNEPAQKEPGVLGTTLAAVILIAWFVSWAGLAIVILASGFIEWIAYEWKGLEMNQKKLIVAFMAFAAFLLLSGCGSAVKWTIQDRDAYLAECLKKKGSGAWKDCGQDADAFSRMFTGYPELASKE